MAQAELPARPDGDLELVHEGVPGRCGKRQIPDAPARAFRDEQGRVHLLVSDQHNWALVGPDLDSVKADCADLMEGAKRDDPGEFDDRAWITATYTLDGKTIHALVHNEFHGHARPALCPRVSTWLAGAMRLQGRSHVMAAAALSAQGLVATPPYRYDGTRKTHLGYFNPSNIVRVGSFFYSLIFATRWDEQAPGACLIRTDRLEDRTAWRGWDGAGFNVRFADPYREAHLDPGQHVCRPLAMLTSPVSSLVQQREGGYWIATLAGHEGVYVSTSRDMLAWSRPQMIWAAPITGTKECGHEFTYNYPALLDPEAPGRNFESVGETAWLYMTRFHMKDCRPGAVRDLVRLKVRINPAAGPAAGAADP